LRTADGASGVKHVINNHQVRAIDVNGGWLVASPDAMPRLEESSWRRRRRALRRQMYAL
jgi:hypothetical protein